MQRNASTDKSPGMRFGRRRLRRMERINARAVLRQAMQMLGVAKCPECGRDYDPSALRSPTSASYSRSLNCSWCKQREMLFTAYQVWQMQDARPGSPPRESARWRSGGATRADDLQPSSHEICTQRGLYLHT